MENDVILNKISIIERCTKRIQEEYENNPENLTHYTKQDSIILNLQRACEASIDLAMHTVAKKKLGLPQSSREAFDLRQSHYIIDELIAKKLKALVGFRNIVFQGYQAINLTVLQAIIEEHLMDFLDFSQIILQCKD